jgi:hypothetical protein
METAARQAVEAAKAKAKLKKLLGASKSAWTKSQLTAMGCAR